MAGAVIWHQGRVILKRTGINPVSKKQKVEIKRRQELKAELIKEHGEHCMSCGDKNRDYQDGMGWLHLSHIIPLSKCGKTDKSNCILECRKCHNARHGIIEK